uniref:Retinol dehydrogenase 12-like n=1 Tax=Phallusia mammillata TaxID=59560 RepID=A0A6F9DBJ7_9ASCI|nr:retinol dehydrogenase 12-like [Phallusia mammillata]
MTGQTAIITGANGGLGKALAVEFAKRNARVILACRSLIRGEAARMEIVADSGCRESNIVLKTLDLSSLQSVREFANHVVNNEERLDILVNNAAIFGKPIIETKDKMDLTYQTNHFGPFLLTNLLLDLLKRSGPGSRIINMSSFMHDMCALDLDYLKPDDFGVFCATKQMGRLKQKPEILLYNNSKLMNIMFARELARRLGERGVTTNCLSPGIVRTNILASDKRIMVMIVMIFMLVVS